MRIFKNKFDTPVALLSYKGVEAELFERGEVWWAGCVDYAADNSGESDYHATLRRYAALAPEAAHGEYPNPDWSAALSLNYKRADRPSGIFIGAETGAGDFDARFDRFKQPGGLWLRLRNDRAAAKLLRKRRAMAHEYFSGGILAKIAMAHGYIQNPDISVEIEYYSRDEYSSPDFTSYACIPVIKAERGLAVSSPAFTGGGWISDRHSAYGENISPGLDLDGIDGRAVSVIVTLDDLGHPIYPGYNHWIAWNLPPVSFIPENLPKGAMCEKPLHIEQGLAYGKHCYRGPKPPFNWNHEYKFTVYTLDSKIAVNPHSDKNAVLDAALGHILQIASLSGRYQRHHA